MTKYLFECVDVSTGNCVQRAKLTPNDGAIKSNFGFSVAIFGSVIVVGAHVDSGQTGVILVQHICLNAVILVPVLVDNF